MRKIINNSMRSLAATLLTVAATAASADLKIAQQPLFLGKSAEPNIMFVLDDSASMLQSYLPDDASSTSSYYRALSPDYNKQYFDPGITYRVPIRLPVRTNCNNKATFNCAFDNGFDKDSAKIDLSRNNYRYQWSNYNGPGSSVGPSNKGAVYYRLKSGCSNSSTSSNCWTEHKLLDKTVQEQQNFANWYSYYRTRHLAARAGIGFAFDQLDETVRVGFGAINAPTKQIDGISSIGTILLGVRPFDTSSKNKFFEMLYGYEVRRYSTSPNTTQTPLRRALDDAGKYFERKDDAGPWGSDPATGSHAVTSPDQLSCRQNATVLMTDGYWTEGNNFAARTIAARADLDGDGHANTLADVAMYYWNRNLRTDLSGISPNKSATVANWPHMRTFTVALGLEGNVTAEYIAQNPNYKWPNPTASGAAGDRAKLDDALHAAINGRGGFFSASDPDTFANELNSMLSELVEETRRAAAAVSTNSTQIEEGTLLYQASMQSGTWKGELRAFGINPETNVVDPNPKWEAGSLIKSTEHASRNIYTYDTENKKGIEFKWDKLTATQKSGLSESLVNYLRGDKSNEGTGEGKFRVRASLLGDIVNSSPEYVGGRNYMLHLLPDDEGSSYPDWLKQTKTRDDTIYVGSNNGMLHAFDAKTGTERFAYVPNSIISELPKLAEQGYQHTFYVDGSPKAMDVYLNGDWKTVLVGSTGAGGNSVFALDVSDPANPEVLWEFTHDELGYRVQQPTIARLKNDDWVAVFGNGYNSNSKTAQLFLVSLATGNARVIDTEIGSKSSPNGLADPAPVDLNGDRITDVIYAGDYHGNMYKFDLSKMKTDDTLSSAEITVSTLYEAVEGSSQPITSRPEVSGHPDPGAVMVFFGTGQYFLEGDDVVGVSPTVQSFYGIVDRNSNTPIKRVDLLEQTILKEELKTFGTNSYMMRTISQEQDSTKTSGWYLDLKVKDKTATGERVVSSPTVQGGRVRFLTFTPSEDPCGGGGSNWLMEIDALSGGLFHKKIWDLSGDGTFDSVGGGAQLGDGPPGRLSRSLSTGDGPNKLFIDPTEDPIGVDDGTTGAGVGRQSWRELN